MGKNNKDPALDRFKAKRKWQIALRRYVLEKQMVSFYAPYFGLDISNFRRWIELQFEEETNWDNFGKNWQFGHVVPLGYFDSTNEGDLKLCWNFINIRVEKADATSGKRIDALTAKAYFEHIFKATGYLPCQAMIKKIDSIEALPSNTSILERFIVENYEYLHSIREFSSYEFEKLNSGVRLSEIFQEKVMLSKFGK